MADHGIPAASIPPVAEAVAKRLRTIGAVMLTIGGVFLLTAVAVSISPNGGPRDTALGGFFWVLILFWFYVRLRAKAMRAIAAGQRATSDPSVSWVLRGMHIIATDAKGECPELTFAIRPAHRTMLVLLPDARVVK